MTRGIYIIRNIITGENYIGASRNVEARLEEHRRALLNGKSTTKPLQAAWAIHGADAFEFAVLEANVPMEQLNAREKHHIAQKEAACGSLGYNRNRGGGAIPPTGLSPMQRAHRQNQLAREARVRAIQMQRGEGQPMTDEELAAATARMLRLRDEPSLWDYDTIRLQQAVDVPLLLAEVERLRKLLDMKEA